MSVFDGYDGEPVFDPHTDPNDQFYLPDEEVPALAYGRHARRSVEDDLQEAIDLVRTAKSMPLSSSALISREDLLAVLEDAQRNLPEEVREARWALREREALMLEEQRKIDVLMERAQARADALVEQTEIVRQARITAQQIVADAEAASRKMVNEHEDFLDLKLAEFEKTLGFLLTTVQRGRSRLATQTLPEPTHISAMADQFFAEATPPQAGVFDYDADLESDPGF
jgi:hypothetical protein